MRTGLMLAILLAAPAAAEVRQSAADSFVIEQTLTIAAPPDAVWSRLGAIASWWDAGHSYSGKAENLSLEPRAGGCFCERLANGGSVEHARVVHADPGRLLRMSGGLGPLQAEASAATLSFALAAEGQGTRLTMTYVVGGHLRGRGVMLAPAVDGVLAQQLARLKAAVER